MRLMFGVVFRIFLKWLAPRVVLCSAKTTSHSHVRDATLTTGIRDLNNSLARNISILFIESPSIKVTGSVSVSVYVLRLPLFRDDPGSKGRNFDKVCGMNHGLR
jgi:hypothetical protein